MRIVASWLATVALAWTALPVASALAEAAHARNHGPFQEDAPEEDAPEAEAAQEEESADAGAPAAAAEPADPPHRVLVRAERLIVRPGEVRENTAVLIEDGRIVRIGADLEAPEGAEVVEGAVVCAGFIDPWSALGMDRESRVDRSASPATRAADGWNPFADPHLRHEALRAGVTAVHLQTGAAAAIGGLGALVRLDPELGTRALVLDDACVSAAIGLSAERFFGGSSASDPFDRIGQIDKLAQELASGLAYRRSWAEYEAELAEWKQAIAEKEEELEDDFKKAQREREKDMEKAEERGREFRPKRYREDRKPRRPNVDVDDAVMARVAHGEVPLVVEAHRGAEIRNLLDATKDFPRLRLVIAGATEARHLAERLAERRVTVIVWPSLRGSGGEDEFESHDLALAGDLAAQGVEVLIGSGGRLPAATRDLPLLAAVCVGHGLEREDAFSALTLDAARALDVADRLGSIELGKDGELLVLDGEPLAGTTRVQYVISAGRVAVTPED